jgi:hypothetical protein
LRRAAGAEGRAARAQSGGAGANKNFIGIVEVNNELPINPRPICGSTRLAFPGSFILALAQFVKPAPPMLLHTTTLLVSGFESSVFS